MKKLIFIMIVLSVGLSYAQKHTIFNGAYEHIKEQFDRYHEVSYVYSDDYAGGNIYIPSIWQGEIENIYINQEYTENPASGRSCTKIVFPLGSSNEFSAIKYVYPENNIGTYKGFDVSGATELSFYAKGNGIVEFLLGGMNCRPFYSDTLQFKDGVDIKSSGFIELTDDWKYQTIDLSDKTFWVYKDSTSGLNNRYIQPMFMDHYSYFDFYYGADNGQNGTCMKIYWFGGNYRWAGVFLFPPEGDWTGTQGYDLTEITKVHFKAKISEAGNVKFLFGKEDDSCGRLTRTYTLSQDWQWYEWDLLSSKDYSDVVGGFGFFFGGDIGTPNNSMTYIDSVYYEGVELSHDFSNLICGFTVSATKNLNPEGVSVYIDEISFNKNRTEKARFCQSFVCGNDSIDITQKNSAYTYDNALKLIADLVLYKTTLNTDYLDDAILLGDAFIYAINNDRFFDDGRLRNAYMSGVIIHYDGTVRIPGWWDDSTGKWYEDKGFVSTSTGNVVWAGLALASLYEETQRNKYLNASETLANWCIDNTETDYGFTGGFEGWGPTGQNSILWKSTEHNIDLYALFTRLYSLTFDSKYHKASQKAKNFVLSMWNSENNHFWTGTIEDGKKINKTVIPLDIQAWYIMAFKDTSSEYSAGINWANKNCYLNNFNSPNYVEPLYGFDFNTDLDGIWFEGSSQAALANKMKGNMNFVEPVLSSIEYIQKNHSHRTYYNCNDKGIVAADQDHVSTGFDWEYHNRLHIGATAWYIFAKSGFNPYYYYSYNDTTSIDDKQPYIPEGFKLYQNYPNPFNPETTISYYLPKSFHVKITIYSILGQHVTTLIDEVRPAGIQLITWDGTTKACEEVTSGVYIYRIEADGYTELKKLLLIK